MKNKLMKLFAFILLIFPLCFFFKKDKEVARFDDLGLLVKYRSSLFYSPQLILSSNQGVIYSVRSVGKGVLFEDVKVHADNESVVVFTGKDDFVWYKEVWSEHD